MDGAFEGGLAVVRRLCVPFEDRAGEQGGKSRACKLEPGKRWSQCLRQERWSRSGLGEQTETGSLNLRCQLDIQMPGNIYL